MSRAPLWWYFGKSWGAPICDAEQGGYEQGATPEGSECSHCGVAIVDGDQGIMMPLTDAGGTWPIPYHIDCFTCSVIPDAKCPVCSRQTYNRC